MKVLWFLILAGVCCTAGLFTFDKAAKVKVVRVEEKTDFWQKAKLQAGVLHQDVGYPVVYPGGSLWLFGDTFYGRVRDANEIIDGAVTNSIMHLDLAGAARYLTGERGLVKAAIPLELPETWKTTRLWPFSGLFIGKDFYVFHSITALTGGVGFKHTGIGLARSENGDWRSWRRLKVKGAFPFKEPPCWLLSARDGFVYGYFVETSGFESSLRVAKMRAADLDNPAAWEVLPAPVLKDVFGQVSVVWNDYLGKYVMVHAGNIFKEPKTIWLRVADSPVGPFSKPVKVFEKPGKTGDNFKGIVYCTYIHSELTRENGRIITISYGVNLEDYGDPHLLEIELEKRL